MGLFFSQRNNFTSENLFTSFTRSYRRQEMKRQFIKSVLKTKEYYGHGKAKGLFPFERSRHYYILFDRENILFHSLTFQQNTSLPSEALASWHEARCFILSAVRFPCMVTLLLSSMTVTFKIWRSPATQFSVKLWEYLKGKKWKRHIWRYYSKPY